MNLTLCLFTNCHKNCLSKPTIFNTLKSYRQTFGKAQKVEIYCDPNPNPDNYDDYSRLIQLKTGIAPIKTTGLDNGWKRAIETATTPYLFMCEADWEFHKDIIRHSTEDMTSLMEQNKLWCLLFNKHKNDDTLNGTKWQTYFKPTENIYCLTDRFSNNPNIIEVDYFKKNILDMVDWNIGGAGHIEQVLQKKVEIAVYGKYGQLPAIKHKNCRRGGKK